MAQRPPRPSRLGRLRNPWGEASARAAYVLEAAHRVVRGGRRRGDGHAVGDGEGDGRA